MKIKHNELEIPDENPFKNCKLDREKYSNILTDIITTYSDGFVMAVNNDWGTGKTTFIKMWQKHLINKGFETIYFNAWENDFETSPLVAFMAEFNKIKGKDKDLIKSLAKRGATLTKHIAPILLKALADKYISVDSINEGIKAVTEGAAEILENDINEYTQRKENISEFKNQLTKFVGKINKNKPLVFIIDELDRCRPTYAVELLEQIKHLFSIPGIVFVLSIDKEHLASSVKGFYGSDKINTDEYLRRFIDLEYSIPAPSHKQFVDYLYSYYGFDNFFLEEERIKNRMLSEDKDIFLKITKHLFDKSNIILRQQEKIFAYTRLILCSFGNNQYLLPDLLFFLIFLKTINNQAYKKIENNEYSLQELSDLFYETIGIEYNNHIRNILYREAKLLWLYNNNKEYQNREKLYKQRDTDNLIIPIKSKFEISDITLADCFNDIRKENYLNFNLTFLINKINLTESLSVKNT